MSERGDVWFWGAALFGIGGSRFVIHDWNVWLSGAVALLVVAAAFARVLYAPWIRQSIQNGVNVSYSDPRARIEIGDRRFQRTRVTIFAAVLLIVYGVLAALAFLPHA